MTGYKILHRGDTKANWELTNPVLSARELAIETDTNKLKLGDGITPYSELPYVGANSDGGGSFKPFESIREVRFWQADGMSGGNIPGVNEGDLYYNTSYKMMLRYGKVGGGSNASAFLPFYGDSGLNNTTDTKIIYHSIPENRYYAWNGVEMLPISSLLSDFHVYAVDGEEANNLLKLQSVIDAAPMGSTIYLHGVSFGQEEYDGSSQAGKLITIDKTLNFIGASRDNIYKPNIIANIQLSNNAAPTFKNLHLTSSNTFNGYLPSGTYFENCEINTYSGTMSAYGSNLHQNNAKFINCVFDVYSNYFLTGSESSYVHVENCTVSESSECIILLNAPGVYINCVSHANQSSAFSPTNTAGTLSMFKNCYSKCITDMMGRTSFAGWSLCVNCIGVIAKDEEVGTVGAFYGAPSDSNPMSKHIGCVVYEVTSIGYAGSIDNLENLRTVPSNIIPV